LRKFFRKLAILPIKLWAKEIWGVGNRAIFEYKVECGKNKKYKNLPYFTYLEPFKKEVDNTIKTNPTILFSGSLSKRKGADLFYHAISDLLERNINFNVIVLGTGEYLDLFYDLKYKYDDRIEIPGFVQLNDVPTYYLKSTILAFPSRHDGWGMTLTEGMASGLAVISTPHAGAAIDLIKHGKNGLIIETGSYKDLYFALKYLIKNPSIVQSLGKNAQTTMLEYSNIKGAIKFANYTITSINSYCN